MNIPVRKTLIIILSLLLCFVLTSATDGDAVPVYRVMLDPGHGGADILPWSQHGDRYDPLSRTYRGPFRSGASWRHLEERNLMYTIAEKTESWLALTATPEGFTVFTDLLARFGRRPLTRVIIAPALSRPPSISDDEAKLLPDPNGPYRVFDYPSPEGMRPGRISRINAFRPHLVLSLHCDSNPPAQHRSLSAIIAPPYEVFAKAMDYLSGRTTSKDMYYRDPYVSDFWLMENSRRSGFFWFLNDSSIYFTGYPLTARMKPDYNRFLGIKHNMAQWGHADASAWASLARAGYPSYLPEAEHFVPKGNYWNRERSAYEGFKRSGGEEGFGGDNYYASMELIRFIIQSLEMKNGRHPELKAGKPYYSSWSVPLLVNAINAYIEIGYLRSPYFRKVLSQESDTIAQGIAVAAYCLLAPTEVIIAPTGSNPPRGKRIDLSKYQITPDTSYFDMAATR